MDAGMDPPELGNEHVLQVGQYFEEVAGELRLKQDGFSAEERIGIMDELFAGVVRWVAGDTLGQTVFSCLYLHQPGYFKDEILRGYCLAILKICSMIRDVIYKAHVYEVSASLLPLSLKRLLKENSPLITGGGLYV